MIIMDREKLIVIHVDGLFQSKGYGIAKLVTLYENLKLLLSEAEQSGKRVVRIDESSPKEIEEADVYIVANGVGSVEGSMSVIRPGDNVALAGLYRNVCLALVSEKAEGIGAHPRILPNMTVDMPVRWDD